MRRREGCWDSGPHQQVLGVSPEPLGRSGLVTVRPIEDEEETVVLFVGDDWAEAHHDIEVQDDQGRVLARRRLPESLKGMARLHQCWPNMPTWTPNPAR